MSNQADLDWLARNVHKWRDGMNFICVNHTDGGFVFHVHDRNCAAWFGRDQWLARRAELQNKPSWADAPEGLDWLSQVTNGGWFFCSVEPVLHDDGESWFAEGYPVVQTTCAYGEVLGDWRDTLERRPESTKQQEQVMEQQADQKQDNSWFERGELPPVGTVCEVLWNEGRMEYLRTKVFGVNEHGQPIHRFDEGPKKFEYQADPLVTVLGARVFRPIRTEREKAIEEMKQHCPHHGSWDNVGRIYAEALYDAGYRKESK